MKTNTENAVIVLGVQGGKIFLENETTETSFGPVFYSYVEGKNNVPSILDLEKEINRYLELAVPLCVYNFSVFKEQGITVDEINISANTGISKTNVIVSLDYELIVNKKSRVKGFRIELPLRLNNINNYANQIIERIKSEPDWIDFTFLSEFDLPMEVMPNNSTDEILISITDPLTKLQNKDFVYVLAMKYNANPIVDFYVPDTFTVKDETDFNGFKIESNSLTFNDDSALVTVTDDGQIMPFTAHIPGEYIVNITGVNSTTEISKLVKFIIQE